MQLEFGKFKVKNEIENKEGVKMETKNNVDIKVKVVKPLYKGFKDGNNTVVYDCNSLHFIRRGKIAFFLIRNKTNYLNAMELKTLYQLPQYIVKSLEDYKIRAGIRFRANKPIGGKYTKVYFCGNSVVIRKGYYAFVILRNTERKQFTNRLTQPEIDLLLSLPEKIQSKIIQRATIEIRSSK